MHRLAYLFRITFPIFFVNMTFCIYLMPEMAKGRSLYDSEKISTIAGKHVNNEPFVTVGVHKINKLAMTVSNQGHFGKGFIQGATDPEDGGPAPSCTYPYPGRISYLFAGAFWIGAVVGQDTLVSVGADGWHGTKELWPDPYPRGDIIRRSISDPSQINAVSEQDFIAIYTDTVTDPSKVTSDPYDERPHIPLNIEVTQRSYAWSYSYAEDFILFDYSIKNIGNKTLEEVFMGFYVDGDVNYEGAATGYDDDICGFRREVQSPQGCGFLDTVNIAYIADNDGKQTSEEGCPYMENTSPTSVTGMRVVRTPSDSLQYSFNWWISNGNAALDFGPRKVGTPEDPFRDFGGFLGTPEGDLNKYYIMRHEEFDYDQLFSAVDHTHEGWLPPDAQRAADFADGYDTRYLLSFGPFDIDPGEVLPVSFAYVAGAEFHHDCRAFDNIFNAYQPQAYYNQLNFTQFGLNSIWSSWIYDNPGVDTDDDGFRGKYRICGYDSILTYDTLQFDPLIVDTFYEYTSADTLFYEGDGVPDFLGASPPPAPDLWILDEYGDTVSSRIYAWIDEYNRGNIRVRWNGFKSETEKDVFSGLVDFEGYRVYVSNSPLKSEFTVISSYDRENYNKYIWNYSRQFWELKDPPYSIDSLKTLYGDGLDPNIYYREHPFNWGDSVFYFAAQDWNQSDLTDSSNIYKVYPNEPPPTTLIIDSAEIYHPEELTPEGHFKYYEYEIIIDNLLPSRLYYIAVTAFDYGAPGSALLSLETPVTQNYVAEYAQNSAYSVEEEGLDVIVYPNPYRIDQNYSNHGFEGKDYTDGAWSGHIVQQAGLMDERTRSIHFANLPHKCTIRIYTLDGDLVRVLDHDYPPGSPRAMHERWDLITRNTQMVASGIYYYSVESERGNQLGKLVIIK